MDHQVWKQVKAHELQPQKILVALSGGADSVALLRCLQKVHRDVIAAYFHHGPSADKKQKSYRDKAGVFCQRICQKWDIPFFLLEGAGGASSEEGLREQRYQALRNLMEQQGASVLALAHHRDDLLETRVLRLIRGTGMQGLQAMHVYKPPLFRPFLQTTKKQLWDYLRAEKVSFIKDPSNAASDSLRNWLRNKWLPALEKKQPGGAESLARSLEVVAEEVGAAKTQDLWQENRSYFQDESAQALSRAYYLSLSVAEQKRLLAQYLLACGKRDFSQSQLEEIRKRLDNPQKVLRFTVARMHWVVNAQQIEVQS